MATLTTGKAAEVLFEKAVETHEHQESLLNRVEYFEPDAGDMQNAGNFIWRPAQQHAPTISGWDMTGSETGVIEETYPAVLGTPENDIIELRADDMRDPGFWERRGKESGMKQASALNKAIADAILNTGSIYYRTNATSGYDAIAEAQAILNERQKLMEDPRYFLLNDRDNLKYAKDLASRETIQGRPERTWGTGLVGQNVAGFEEILTGAYLGNLTGGAASTTTTAAVSDAPTAGTVNSTTGVVTNSDYRESSSIAVTSSASFAVGDYVTFATSGAATVESLALTDKTPSGQAMTFKIVAIADSTHVTLYPKPIALDDAGLSTLEKAYANINTQIDSGATMTRVNTDASAKANLFWSKSSIEVLGGDVPMSMMSDFGGMKVISTTMSNGQKMYMAYDGNIKTMQFTCRIFTWYGVTNKDPSANGVMISY